MFSYSVTQSALSKTSTDVASSYSGLQGKIKNNCPGTDVPSQRSGFRFASLDCVHSTRDDNSRNDSGDRYDYANVLAGTEVSGYAETSSGDQQKMGDIVEIKKINIGAKGTDCYDIFISFIDNSNLLEFKRYHTLLQKLCFQLLFSNEKKTLFRKGKTIQTGMMTQHADWRIPSVRSVRDPLTSERNRIFERIMHILHRSSNVSRRAPYFIHGSEN